MKSRVKLLIAQLLLVLTCNFTFAQESANYSISPNEPWDDISNLPQDSDLESSDWAASILMYLPNRFLDLVDIFKVDLGVGLSTGAVVRITKHGQAGFRSISPASARIGLLGRRAPLMLETSSEKGIGPAYKKSIDRNVCWGEVGAGLDLLVIGAYAGVCPDEFVDFVGGFFFLDFKGDDLR